MANSFQSFFKSRVLLHVTGWMIFFVTPLLLSPPNELAEALKDTSNLESMAIRNLLLMALFYLNLFYLAPTILKRKGAGSFLLIIVPLVLMVSYFNWQIHHFLSEAFMPPMGDRPPPPFDGRFGPRPRRPFMMVSSLFASLLITILVTSISTILVLWSDWVKAKETEHEQAFQKVASELAVLKLQISPHFLFNTLNNIRWLVRSKSDKAEDAVIKLSQLLRYILYQTNQEKIGLEKELSNLQDYISLQQMRLTGHDNLIVSIIGDAQHKSIVPLLFIPLVENVFKYGDFNSTFQNLIELHVEGYRLTFRTENKIIGQLPEGNKEDSGIGLSNVKQRLQLHYPDRHILNYREKEGIFILELEILLS